MLEMIDSESPREVILITPEISPEKTKQKSSPQINSKDVSPQDKKDTKNWTYVESESSDEEGDLTCQKCQVNELLSAKFSQKGSLFRKISKYIYRTKTFQNFRGTTNYGILNTWRLLVTNVSLNVKLRLI